MGEEVSGDSLYFKNKQINKNKCRTGFRSTWIQSFNQYLRTRFVRSPLSGSGPLRWLHPLRLHFYHVGCSSPRLSILKLQDQWKWRFTFGPVVPGNNSEHLISVRGSHHTEPTGPGLEHMLGMESVLLVRQGLRWGGMSPEQNLSLVTSSMISRGWASKNNKGPLQPVHLQLWKSKVELKRKVQREQRDRREPKYVVSLYHVWQGMGCSQNL